MKKKNILLKVFRQLRLIRQIGFSAYAHYRLASKGQQIKIVINGHSIIVRKGTPDLNVAASSLNGEFDILKYLLPADYRGVIVDAGGYIGTASIALRSIFPKAKLLVIEPSDDNLEVLKENLSDLTNVEIVHGALVGTSENTIQLNNMGTGEWGFTVVASPSDKPDAVSLQETQAFRLSDLIKENEKIGLLKLDIEGGERSLLEHDMQSLKSIDVVFAELHDRIVPGCEEKYLEFSKDRVLVKGKGEKYLSVKR